MGGRLSNTDRLQIDWCPTERIPTLQEFIDIHWKRGGHILARDAKLLRWQYEFPEDDQRLSVLVAQQDNATLGMLGLIHFGFCMRGERLPGAWLTTWLSVPETQAPRVGLRLLQKVLTDDYTMVGTLGGNAIAQRILGALRFDLRDSIPRWVRVISTSKLESLLAERAEPYPPEAWAAWRATAQRSMICVPGSSLRVVNWTEDNAERWDQTWRERFAPALQGTWRDADYLRWRYVDHPRFQYVLRFAEDTAKGVLTGLLVYRVETVDGRDEKVLRVVDFLSDENVGSLLSAVLVEAGEAEGVAFADFSCTSGNFIGPLEAVGFAPEKMLPARLPRLFQPLDFTTAPLTGAFWVKPAISNNSRSFFRSPSLYFTGSDCDQDRPN